MIITSIEALFVGATAGALALLVSLSLLDLGLIFPSYTGAFGMFGLVLAGVQLITGVILGIYFLRREA